MAVDRGTFSLFFLNNAFFSVVTVLVIYIFEVDTDFLFADLFTESFIFHTGQFHKIFSVNINYSHLQNDTSKTVYCHVKTEVCDI